MTSPPDGDRTTDLLVRLAWRDGRTEVADLLATRLRVARVLIFVRDAQIDAMLAAPGMAQTLHGGPAWRSFLKRCETPGRHEAVVDLEGHATGPALALVWGNLALVLVGGEPQAAELAVIEPLLPMLGAALGCEQQVVLAEAEATEARTAAGHATVLARALEESRAEGAALNVRLREEHRRKDDFLAMLAHELRNPLSPLVTSIELLRRHGGDTGLVDRQLDAMARQVDQLSRLVEDLLDVSRVRHGRISLRRERLILGDIIEHALESSRLLIDVRRHRVSIEGLEPPVVLEADRVRLTQVFANLINNAAKYSEPGSSITIAIACEREVAVVQVSDNGIGIAPAILPRVFDLFEQSPMTRGRAQGGLGIGLTLVKSLVGLHQGTVQAQSAGLGQGSTFTIRLPLGGQSGREHGATPQRTPMPPPAPGQDSLRVLVVDDNQDAADSLAEILRMLGHQAAVAHSGLRAIQMANDVDADLLLLDIGLPEMDGHELARRLRRATHRHARFVALTGYGSDEDKRLSLEAGFDEHVVKPIRLNAIREIVARAVQQRRQGGSRTR